MKKISKWPARALNLLVVLAMVISLSAILVAPPIAAAQCNPTEVHAPCYLEVFVNTYVKDAGGDFTQQSTFNVGDWFYVNAVVVNTGNATCIGNASGPCLYKAAIELDDATMALDPSELLGGNKTAEEPIDQLGNVHMQDFWWRVNCTAEGNGNITVNVTTSGCQYGACGEASGSACVEQVMPPAAKCLDIEIIEAPGLNSPLPLQISESTNFGIKARITNRCAVDFGNVTATLTVDNRQLAHVINDTYDWPIIGGIPAGESEIVAWTLHCDAPGDVSITVNATEYIDERGVSLDDRTNFINNPHTVIQIVEGRLEVTIDTPGNGTKIPTGCGQNTFPIVATVKNVGHTTLTGCMATVFPVTGFSVTGLTQRDLGNISGGGNKTATWSATCTGVGDPNILVTASGTIAGGGTATGNDTHVIHQDSLITKFVGAYVGNGTTNGTPLVIPLDEEGNPLFDGQVNICQQYQVVFSVSNYTGTNWTDAAACIHWTGNATRVAGLIYERKYTTGNWGNWTVKAESSGNATTSCISSLEICSCCIAEIKWTFECTGDTDATFYAVGTRQALTDTSATVSISQEWKAHLMGGMFPFFQDEDMIMQPRDAFAPSQQFHVVYPVVNTGYADAKDVVVNFQITGAGLYEFVSFSGDVVEGTFDPQTGMGHAHLGDIAGKSSPDCTSHMKKMILLVECKEAGDVKFQYFGVTDGITGTDENTYAAIQASNIVYPACPITVEQIPFTVEILNPIEDENFEYSDNYSVKALISNLSAAELEDVTATLSWGAGDPVELVALGNGTPQTLEKDMGDLEAGRLEEITWQVHCNGEGDVTFTVTAVSVTPSLNAVSDSVTVHQIPAPELVVRILSPADSHDGTNTTIATGEQFAVTAMVLNQGGMTAEDVQVEIGDYNGNVTFSTDSGRFDLGEGCITPGSETIWVDDVAQVRDVDYTINYAFGNGTFINIPPVGAVVDAIYLDKVSLVAPLESVQEVGDLAPDEHAIVTWTMRAETTCQGGCTNVTEDLDVSAWGSNADWVWDTVEPSIDIYPAAFLVTVIGTVTPVVKVCDEFEVSYKVYNIGQADAWNASATLSVTPEGSVRIAGGQTGYTQPLGTIAGWRSGNLTNRAYAEGTFTLHCKMVCESTITITPAGYDECGWGPVLTNAPAGFNGVGRYGQRAKWLDYYRGYEWVSLPGTAIKSKFLEAASTTVKQLDSGQLDLGITKTVDNAFPTVGQTVNFTIMVTNSGPTAASGVKVHDALPAGLTFVSATASQGSYSNSTKDWTVGSLIVGGSASLKIAATVGSTSLITNTASITAVDQPDPYSDNDSASVNLNVPAVTSVDIALKSGWNLISLPLIPTNSAIATVLAGVVSQVSIVYGYDSTWSPVWKSYIPGGPTPSLTTMVDGRGYWINMTAAATLTVNGVVNPLPPTTPPAYSVSAGWNLIGFKSTTAMAAGDYLAAIAGQWTRIWGFTNGQYGAVTSSGMLQPGGGYWIALTSAGTIFP